MICDKVGMGFNFHFDMKGDQSEIHQHKRNSKAYLPIYHLRWRKNTKGSCNDVGDDMYALDKGFVTK